MRIIPSIVRFNNFKIHKSAVDGVRPIARGVFEGKDGDYLDLVLESPADLNMITLFEKGNNVTDFEIYYEKDGEFIRVYRQNRIADFRLCALPKIAAQKIRVKVCGTRKGFFKDIQVFAYCMPKKERGFRKTAYIITDNYEKIDPASLKHYNKFNIIGGIEIGEDGGVCFKTEKFHESLALVREHDPQADVVVTVFFRNNILRLLKSQAVLDNIKAFIDEYSLNGISFDWEFPKNLYEWRVFDRFIVRLKKTIGEKNITIALPSWMPYHFSQKAIDSIDVAEIMTYDNMKTDIDGHHSEFFSNGPNAIYHLVHKGFRLAQLDLGLSYYARTVDATGYWKNYADEVDKLDRFTNVVTEEYRDLDWKKKEITVKARFYNCCQMIEDKTAFCVYANVGGIMIWSMNSDAPESHELCLSKVVDKALDERTK